MMSTRGEEESRKKQTEVTEDLATAFARGHQTMKMTRRFNPKIDPHETFVLRTPRRL